LKPLLASALLLLAACQSSPWRADRFAPAPLEVRIGSEHDPAAQARVLVTVIGLTRADGAAHVRIRCENVGERTLRLLPEKLTLVGADLAAWSPARVSPEPAAVPPGAEGTYDAVFGLPAGKGYEHLDLSGLNLRVTLDFEGRPVTAGLSFSRVYDAYGYYAEPRVHVGVGVGIHAD
jgi:hypothetical protein